jgi:hypothetical protein
MFRVYAARAGADRASIPPGGGRTWWAHFEFTRINIKPIILYKKIEELMNVQGIGEKNFLKLKPQIAVGTAKTDHDQPQR